jgi:DNA-directed RNA polymerase specialized sigma24 family protein
MSRNFVSDQVLLTNLRLNDPKAFEELFRRYWHILYIYSLRKLRSSDEARQIIRNLFKELWEKRQLWPADFSLSTYLYAGIRKAVLTRLHPGFNFAF